MKAFIGLVEWRDSPRALKSMADILVTLYFGFGTQWHPFEWCIMLVPGVDRPPDVPPVGFIQLTAKTVQNLRSSHCTLRCCNCSDSGLF